MGEGVGLGLIRGLGMKRGVRAFRGGACREFRDGHRPPAK
jgi:hypothetical protein